jgi:hypothetical protein
MQLSVKFNPKILLSTPRYASLREVTYICNGEFATICKNYLNRQSVADLGLIDEKTEGQKTSDCLFKAKLVIYPVGGNWYPACQSQGTFWHHCVNESCYHKKGSS